LPPTLSGATSFNSKKAKPTGIGETRTQVLQALIDTKRTCLGLGGGRFPYDINVALVPSALLAIERLAGEGILAKDKGAKAASYRKASLSKSFGLSKSFDSLPMMFGRQEALLMRLEATVFDLIDLVKR
jgi:hypothetical protein